MFSTMRTSGAPSYSRNEDCRFVLQFLHFLYQFFFCFPHFRYRLLRRMFFRGSHSSRCSCTSKNRSAISAGTCEDFSSKWIRVCALRDNSRGPLDSSTSCTHCSPRLNVPAPVLLPVESCLHNDRDETCCSIQTAAAPGPPDPGSSTHFQTRESPNANLPQPEESGCNVRKIDAMGTVSWQCGQFMSNHRAGGSAGPSDVLIRPRRRCRSRRIFLRSDSRKQIRH